MEYFRKKKKRPVYAYLGKLIRRPPADGGEPEIDKRLQSHTQAETMGLRDAPKSYKARTITKYINKKTRR